MEGGSSLEIEAVWKLHGSRDAVEGRTNTLKLC